MTWECPFGVVARAESRYGPRSTEDALKFNSQLNREVSFIINLKTKLPAYTSFLLTTGSWFQRVSLAAYLQLICSSFVSGI